MRIADGQRALGIFQKDVFEAKKLELLVRKFNVVTNPAKQVGLTTATWDAITRYCTCRGLNPSKYWEFK